MPCNNTPNRVIIHTLIHITRDGGIIPNLSWRPQASENSYSQPQRQNFQNFQNSPSYRPPHQSQFQQPSPPPPSRDPSFEEKVLASLQSLESLSQTVHSHTQSIVRLESQMGQIANALNRREEGKLPSQPVANPKGQFVVDNTHHEQVHAIASIKYHRKTSDRVGEKQSEVEGVTIDPSHVSEEKVEPNFEKDPAPSPFSTIPEALYVSKGPFPQCLDAPSPYGKKGSKVEDILEVFRQVKINLPLLDAIKQIPAYAKFLKDLCTHKRKSKAHTPKKVRLPEQVSTIIQLNTMPKFKDL